MHSQRELLPEYNASRSDIRASMRSLFGAFSQCSVIPLRHFLLQVASPEPHEDAAAQQPQQQEAASGQEGQRGEELGRLLRLATADGAALQQ
jgi:hypothetical protein